MAGEPRPQAVAGAPAPAVLRVGGLVPFTTTDYPGKLAAVVFAQGCPWRCGYCHNPHLLAPRGGAELAWDGVLDWLDRRQGLLDAVVFSGGEATAQAALAGAVHAVRAKGFAVGLHTAGIYPRRLSEIVGRVDWVGLDIKAPIAAYMGLTGTKSSGPAAFASLDLVQRAGVAFEVRTTVHPALTPSAQLVALARELADHGLRAWVLQRFRPVGCADDALIDAAPTGAVIGEDLLAELASIVPEITLR
jgi:anaerobic ribonucleoside-triphosphate reductase activating protein